MIRYTLLIDGPSGAGKTSLAGLIGTTLGIRVVHLDDFYPGWSGLEQGARMVATDVLDPVRPGYWRWDWEHNRRAGWVALDPGEDLIVEGVGAVTRASICAAQQLGQVNTLRVVADARVRKARALARDANFASYWEHWAGQEAALEQPPVDVVVRSDQVA